MKRRRKATIFYAIVAIVGVILIATGSWYFYQESRYGVYRNKRAGVEIWYPPDWKLTENTGGATALFMAPARGSDDKYRESVNIVVQDLAQKNMTLQQYTALAIRQMEVVFEKNFVVIDSSPTTVDGRAGHRLEFLGKGPKAQGDLRFLIVWTVDGDKAYQVTYAAVSTQFNSELGTAEKMIDSFKIL